MDNAPFKVVKSVLWKVLSKSTKLNLSKLIILFFETSFWEIEHTKQMIDQDGIINFQVKLSSTTTITREIRGPV